MARLELFNSDDIYVIEWGNKLEDLKPQGGFLQITFDYYFDDNEPSSKRTITLESNDTTWIQRMHKLS
jgi:tRNA A37 threonylcarbamoyladenosine biosynthesis protein TsaE